MAKIHPRRRRQSGGSGSGKSPYTGSFYGRKVKSRIFITRSPAPFPIGFEACVVIGSKGHLKSATQCAMGKNPRKALGAALRKAGSAVSKRRGAFAGLKSRRKRRR